MNPNGKVKKPFRERLLELAGFKIWPPTHNDPRIKGPQPRILTKRQWETMKKMRHENEDNTVDNIMHNEKSDSQVRKESVISDDVK